MPLKSRHDYYRALFAMWKQLGVDEEGRRAFIFSYTQKHDSLKLCGMDVIKRMYQDLSKQTLKHAAKADRLEQEKRKRRREAYKRMGKKIIARCCQLGWLKDGKPDYNRINLYIEHIGSNNPRGVALWELDYIEMQKCLNQVERMYNKEVRKA